MGAWTLECDSALQLAIAKQVPNFSVTSVESGFIHELDQHLHHSDQLSYSAKD
jgi:hypothetical protein